MLARSIESYSELLAFNTISAQSALALYCACVRDLLHRMEGAYECQELEGTYMIAFETAQTAIEWAMMMQLLALQVRRRANPRGALFARFFCGRVACLHAVRQDVLALQSLSQRV
jgi:hypothetical protein